MRHRHCGPGRLHIRSRGGGETSSSSSSSRIRADCRITYSKVVIGSAWTLDNDGAWAVVSPLRTALRRLFDWLPALKSTLAFLVAKAFTVVLLFIVGRTCVVNTIYKRIINYVYLRFAFYIRVAQMAD